MNIGRKRNHLGIMVFVAFVACPSVEEGTIRAEDAETGSNRPALNRLEVLNVVPVASQTECFFTDYEAFLATAHDEAARQKITGFWRDMRRALTSGPAVESLGKARRITLMRLGAGLAGFLEGDFIATDVAAELVHKGWLPLRGVPSGVDIGKSYFAGAADRFLVLARTDDRAKLDSLQVTTGRRVSDLELARLLEQYAPSLCYAAICRSSKTVSLRDGPRRLNGLTGWATAIEPGQQVHRVTAVFEFESQDQAIRHRRVCEAAADGWGELRSEQDEQFVVLKGNRAPTAESLHAFLGDNFFDKWSDKVDELPASLD